MDHARSNENQRPSNATALRGWNSVAASNVALNNINQHFQGPPQHSSSPTTRTRVVKGSPATPHSSVPSKPQRPYVTSSSASIASDFSTDEEDSHRGRQPTNGTTASARGSWVDETQTRGRQGAPQSRAQTQAFYGTRSVQQQNNALVSARQALAPSANQSGQWSFTPKAQPKSSGNADAPSNSYEQLRAAQTSQPMSSRSATTSSNEHEQPRTAQASQPVNSGAAAKSAKCDSEFPCPYKDCTLGFSKLKDLKSHKSDKHYYCKRCDVDCEDDEDLLHHKVASDNHICCHECGENFRSEGGRDRHLKLVSHWRHSKLESVLTLGVSRTSTRSQMHRMRYGLSQWGWLNGPYLQQPMQRS